jgi:hypothetical protein
MNSFSKPGLIVVIDRTNSVGNILEVIMFYGVPVYSPFGVSPTGI